MTNSPLFIAESPEGDVVRTDQNECWTAVKKARLINRKQLQLLLPISPMTIWRYEKQGLLPKHFKIGGLSFWRLTAVLDAIERLASSDADKSTTNPQIAEDRTQENPTGSSRQTKSTLISVREGCDRSGEKPATIIGWCARHKIGSHVKTDNGGDWLVDPDRLERLLAEQQAEA